MRRLLATAGLLCFISGAAVAEEGVTRGFEGTPFKEGPKQSALGAPTPASCARRERECNALGSSTLGPLALQCEQDRLRCKKESFRTPGVEGDPMKTPSWQTALGEPTHANCARRQQECSTVGTSGPLGSQCGEDEARCKQASGRR